MIDPVEFGLDPVELGPVVDQPGQLSLPESVHGGSDMVAARRLGEVNLEASALCGRVEAFAEPQPGSAELVSMWVRPELRGRGVARVLVKTVVQWARGEGHAHVHLWVTETNDPARRL